jgi:hypothetical protein
MRVCRLSVSSNNIWVPHQERYYQNALEFAKSVRDKAATSSAGTKRRTPPDSDDNGGSGGSSGGSAGSAGTGSGGGSGSGSGSEHKAKRRKTEPTAIPWGGAGATLVRKYSNTCAFDSAMTAVYYIAVVNHPAILAALDAGKESKASTRPLAAALKSIQNKQVWLAAIFDLRACLFCLLFVCFWSFAAAATALRRGFCRSDLAYSCFFSVFVRSVGPSVCQLARRKGSDHSYAAGCVDRHQERTLASTQCVAGGSHRHPPHDGFAVYKPILPTLAD